MQTQYSSESKDLLEDLDTENVSLVKATMEQRALNLIIDTVIVCVFGFMLLILSAILFPVWYHGMSQDDAACVAYLGVVYAVAMVLYYTIMEAGTKGYTVGKLISGCRAIGYDGQPVSWNDAFLRSLSRLVPFEFLSGIQKPILHDHWTETYVVKR
jgi:uncharacterized RDD family membrane protein YckC